MDLKESELETITRPGRLRRALSLSAAGAMMLALMPAGMAAAEHAPEARDTSNICESDNPNDYDSSFADVGSGPHWVNIVCMADLGITEGVAPDGTNYAPRREVTRGQMASFIVRFIEDYTGESMPPGDPERFDDVPTTDGQYVHASNIQKLAEADIVRGTAASDGQEYAPQASVNRMQMGTFIRLALSWIDDGEARNESAPPAATHDWFPDPSAPVHEDNVDAIAEVGIVEGFEDGTYGPTRSVLRDQMASYIMRAYDYAIEAELGVETDGAIAGTVTAEPDLTENFDFTAFVESGMLEIGDDAFDWPECPDGEPANDDCIYFQGEVDPVAGTHTIPSDGVNFPTLILDAGVADVAINFAAPTGASGTFDATSGEVTFDTDLEVILDVGNDGTDNCTIDVALEGTTGTSGAETGEPLDLTDFRAQIVENEFAVPETEPVTPEDAATCGLVDGFLDLPSPSGDNTAVFNMLFQPEGDPIEGATVSVDGTDLEATTDEDGEYVIDGAPAGTWDVTAEADGFESQTETDVEVVGGETTFVDFVLALADDNDNDNNDNG